MFLGDEMSGSSLIMVVLKVTGHCSHVSLKKIKAIFSDWLNLNDSSLRPGWPTTHLMDLG